jgi:hypothetical protein
VSTESPTQTLPRVGSDCPNCGAHAEPGQLVCLECGTRLALDYRRPRGWRPAVAVIGLVLLIAGAAFAITLISVNDDSKDEVAATKAGQQTAAAPQPKKKAKGTPKQTPTTAGVQGWPANRNGFTVVLLSAGDEASARNSARNVGDQGVDAGVLRSDDYSSLEPNLWIVFSGVYKTRAQAERAAARLGTRFSGAYPQFVNGAESG